VRWLGGLKTCLKGIKNMNDKKTRPTSWKGGKVAENQTKPKRGLKVFGKTVLDKGPARAASNKASVDMWVKGQPPGYFALPGGSGDAKMRKQVQRSTENRKTKDEAEKDMKGRVVNRTQSTAKGDPARDMAKQTDYKKSKYKDGRAKGVAADGTSKHRIADRKNPLYGSEKSQASQAAFRAAVSLKSNKKMAKDVTLPKRGK
jgi:hypothetical protein